MNNGQRHLEWPGYFQFHAGGRTRPVKGSMRPRGASGRICAHTAPSHPSGRVSNVFSIVGGLGEK